MKTLLKIPLKYRASALPVIKAVGEVIHYGERNDFFDYLIDLYLNSTKHNAIVNHKLKYIAGSVNSVYADLRRKCIRDYLLFSGFSFFVYRNIDGSISKLEYCPYSNIRKIKDNDKEIAYSINWVKRTGVFKYSKNSSADVLMYPIYDRGEVLPKSIFIYEDLQFNSEYPVPQYNGSLQYIEMDYRIANYWSNSISTGFAASHIINMYGTGLSEEEKIQIEHEIQSKFGGDDNAGTFILNFVRDKNQSTDIQTIQQPSIDTMLQLLNDAVTQEIFIAHNVTSPMLFGVRVQGQLGGRNELLDAYDVYKSTIIMPLRNEIDNVLQQFIGDVEVKDIEPLSQDYTQLKGILTIDEIREKLGYEPLTSEEKKVLNDDIKMKAVERLKSVNSSECQYIQFIQDIHSRPTKTSECMMLLKFAELSVFELEVLKWLAKDNTLSDDVLAKIVGVDVDVMIKMIDKLKRSGYLDSNRYLTSKAFDILNRDKKTITEVRYSYEWALGFSSKDKKTSRDFCKELLEESVRRKQVNKLWTREEIDSISDEVGWDVWDMRGGWYRVPNTEVSIPHCRHIWKQHLTIKKI